tara:strand:+ start:39823 stop:40101 length:279 start_codon:yes stop_codon:yes gene_type:complete
MALLISPFLSAKEINASAEQPENPFSTVPNTLYHSPFLKYRPHEPIKRQNWKEANRKVSPGYTHSDHNMHKMPSHPDKDLNSKENVHHHEHH